MTEIDGEDKGHQGALLGLFTPFSNSNYKDVITAEGVARRKVVTFRKENLIELIRIFTDDVLKDFSVSIYGSDSDGAVAADCHNLKGQGKGNVSLDEGTSGLRGDNEKIQRGLSGDASGIEFLVEGRN